MAQDRSGDEQAEDEQHRTFGVSGVEIIDSGRIIIPARFRDRYDVEEDDVLDVRVRTQDVTFWALDLVADGSGRIRIPNRKRGIYEVDDGDVVDIDVMTTGMSHSGD